MASAPELPGVKVTERPAVAWEHPVVAPELRAAARARRMAPAAAPAFQGAALVVPRVAPERPVEAKALRAIKALVRLAQRRLQPRQQAPAPAQERAEQLVQAVRAAQPDRVGRAAQPRPAPEADAPAAEAVAALAGAEHRAVREALKLKRGACLSLLSKMQERIKNASPEFRRGVLLFLHGPTSAPLAKTLCR